LSSHVPDLDVHLGQVQGSDILADGGDGIACVFGGGGVACGAESGVGGGIERFDLVEERGFAGVVEAEEEDGVFYLHGISETTDQTTKVGRSVLIMTYRAYWWHKGRANGPGGTSSRAISAFTAQLERVNMRWNDRLRRYHLTIISTSGTFIASIHSVTAPSRHGDQEDR
jgi:hypothetical protein